MNTMKKILAICIVASMSVVAFGCSSGKEETPQETIALEDTKQELQFFYNTGNGPDSTEAVTEKATTTQTTAAAGTDAAQTTEIATQVITEYVPVTEADGQQVTEANGEVQTEVVTSVQTEIVTAPASEDATDEGTAPEAPATEATTEAPAVHTPSYDTCKAYWLDMSQQSDFDFNGEFLVIEFKINENVPDGSYPVTIATTDFGSWELVTRVPECINGEVTVGNAEAAKQSEATTGSFALKVENAKGNPGDTVKVAVDLSNNPGFCGFVVDVQYDAAALTIVDTYGGADFDAAVNVLS